jgi:CubicO group peptidase (beta-lactamase class C family)
MSTENNSRMTVIIQSEINKILAEFPDIHGTVIVAIGNQVLWHQGFSLSKAPVTADKNSQYLVASLTKTFTAIAILKTFLEHFKDLNSSLIRPVSDFLSSSHVVWKGRRPDFADVINIHHLLNHTSGIINMDESLLHDPGTMYSYSNFGYVLLGHVIETLINESIDVYYRRVLFEPAKMDDTFFITKGTPHSIKEDQKFQKLIPGFEKQSDGLETINDKPDFSDLFTAGAIVSQAFS